MSANSRLAWVRAGVALVALVCLGFYLFSLVQYYRLTLEMNQIVLPSQTWTPESFRHSLTLAGESPAVYAWFHIIAVLLFTSGYLVVAGLLLIQKPEDPMALLVAFSLVIFGTGFPPPISTLKIVFPAFGNLVDFWSNLGFTIFFLLFYIFPDGRFVPRWTIWLGLFWVFAVLIGPLFPGTFLDVLSFKDPWNNLVPLVLFVSFIAAQIYRYRRVSNALQKLQTRWVVTGMTTAMAVFILVWVIGLIYPVLNQPGLPGLVFEHVISVAYVVSFVMIPIPLGFAILRYRLFAIDLIIHRTLVYTLLTVLLGGLYFGSVLLLQQVLGSIAANSSAALVISTLLIAALFAPVRRQVQDFIDRRFYRQRYDAAQALEEFSAAARREVELEHLTGQLVNVVEETIQPESISLWLRKD